jgi:hypothetical protein
MTAGTASRRTILLGVVALAIAIPSIGLALAIDAANTIGIGEYDFAFFIGAVAVLGETAVAVGLTILWNKPGNRIGSVMVAGSLLLMSTFTAWTVSITRSADGDMLTAGLANVWGTIALLPAIVLLFPAIGILFPDERLPGPRWRLPVAVGLVPLAIGTIFQVIAPWRVDGDLTVPNPLAIPGVSTALSEVGGGLAAGGTFILFAVAVAAVAVRYRRSAGVERAQQKWLVASVVAMAFAFPFSYATSVGPDVLIDLLSVLTGALVPVAVGIAILRYHLFDIDRIVSRTIAYVVITAVLVGAYAVSVVVIQGPLGTVTGGETVSVALSTLVVAALFQPLRRRIQAIVDRRFDRARIDADRTTAAFSERLRGEVDIATVTTDLNETVWRSIRPDRLGIWLREAGR